MKCWWLLSGLLGLTTASAQLPATVRQLIVTTTEGWNTHHGSLLTYSRTKDGGPWKLASPNATPVLLGKDGLAWGRGLLPVPHGENGIPSKTERDGRAPAGCFALGQLFGYAAQPPEQLHFPYYQVTAKDCWIDDPTHPAYNRHVVVDLQRLPDWYAKQHMRLGDFAYEYLLEIRHNAAPPQVGAGSAIFFHIRRGPDRPTAGCTTMARPALLSLIHWLSADAAPHYVLLPRSAYAARLQSWGLPSLPAP